MNSPRKFLIFLAALALLATACGSTTEDATATAAGEREAGAEVTDEDVDSSAEVTADVVETDDDSDSSAEAVANAVQSGADPINGGKPFIETPTGDAPTQLLVEDLIDGDGAVAQDGDLLVMHYVGVLHSDGSEFDSSWDRNQTFNFVLGQGNVIQGWDEGIVGMTEGSRRQLTIPPAQAYGTQGSGGAVPPNSTLVFVVDLVGAFSPHEIDTAVEDPSELDITVVEQGDGPELVAGDAVEVLYTIASASSGEILQSSWTDRMTASFVIGAEPAEVFIGWSEPLVGRNVGDVVRIVVPAALGPNVQSGENFVTQITVLDTVEQG